jgi:hypothetical protein
VTKALFSAAAAPYVIFAEIAVPGEPSAAIGVKVIV